jgi:hypothetical protein
MPIIELPNGQSAVIRSRDEVSERISRTISRAYLEAVSVAAKLVKTGFDDSNPASWDAITSLNDTERNALDGYQVALVVGMISSWTLGDLPTHDTALDLPKATFDALVNACADEFQGKPEEFGPDGVTDPKAPTAE